MNLDYKTLEPNIQETKENNMMRSYALMENEYSQHHIIDLHFYRTNSNKQLLFYFYNIISVGIFYLISRWSIDTYIKYNMDICDINDAEYVFIIDPSIHFIL